MNVFPQPSPPKGRCGRECLGRLPRPEVRGEMALSTEMPKGMLPEGVPPAEGAGVSAREALPRGPPSRNGGASVRSAASDKREVELADLTEKGVK